MRKESVSLRIGQQKLPKLKSKDRKKNENKHKSEHLRTVENDKRYNI